MNWFPYTDNFTMECERQTHWYEIDLLPETRGLQIVRIAKILTKRQEEGNEQA